MLFQMLTIPPGESISLPLPHPPTTEGNYLSTLKMTDFATIKKQQKTIHLDIFQLSKVALACSDSLYYLKGYWILHCTMRQTLFWS